MNDNNLDDYSKGYAAFWVEHKYGYNCPYNLYLEFLAWRAWNDGWKQAQKDKFEMECE